MSDNITFEIYQHDWIPGFAAFADDGSMDKEAKAHIVINLNASLLSVAKKEVDLKELPYLIAEDIMHEIMHGLEAWAKIEFSEDRVEELIAKYRNANS